MERAFVFVTSGLGDNLLTIPMIIELEKRLDVILVVNSGATEEFFRKCFPNLRIISFKNNLIDTLKVLIKGMFMDYWIYPIASCSRKIRIINLLSFAKKKYGFTSLSSEKTWQAEIGLNICLVPDLAKRAWRNNMRLLSLINPNYLMNKNYKWDNYTKIIRKRLFNNNDHNSAFNNALFVHPGSNLYPGGLEKYKRWPIDFFVDVAKTFLKQNVFSKVTFFLGSSDENLHDELKKLLDKSEDSNKIEIIDHQQFDSNLYRLSYFIARYSYFLGNDTGIAHLASFIDIPLTVIMNGIDEPSYIGQDGQKTQIVSHYVECQGCTVGISYNMALKFKCRNNWECMSKITPDLVVNKIKQHLRMKL